MNRREKTKDAHKHNQTRILAALLTALLPAVVTAAPVLTDPDSTTLTAAAVSDPSDWDTSLSPELILTVAGSGNNRNTSTIVTFSIPSTLPSSTANTLTGWTDSLNSLNWGGSPNTLRHTLLRIRLPNKSWPGHDVGRSVPAVTVPAPGSILLGSVGLLLVRALRLRRTIV